MQEESCLPDRPSVHEKLPDTAPLAHDDLGCPIRRDIPSRVYPPDSMGATAKPVSGPPVSPSLFRSPRSSAPERSPKAIQASIKESATLAAAISMQWKEEVSAMRRELAELRRDLCKELRAFNSNFNTFTQHYNTWSPQAAHMTVGVGPSLGGGAAGGQGPGTATAAGETTGTESAAEKSRPLEIDRATLGAREKKPQVSKVSVGTQARSKVLVRQSTADAAVNCPDEKEEKKSGRKGLPKQLSMDPSILASPQSMFVESAIPLDPILPSTVRTFKPKKVEMTIKPAKTRAEPVTKLLMRNVCSSESITGKLESDELEPPKLDFSDDTASDESKETIVLLPYPVPMVTVSPPDDIEVPSDSESLDLQTTDTPDPVTVTTQSSSADQSPVDQEPDPETCDSPPPPYPVSEHFDPEPPESPTDSIPGPLPIANIPEVIISSPPTSEPTSQSSSRQPSCEEDSKDSEWPPLPEPLPTTPIYQSDLVHFDLVMLTSLDQDDLDSVFMDPEPEPLDLSDSLSNSEDPPFYQSDPTSPLPTINPDALCPQSEYLDPSMEYNLDDLPQNFQVPLPLVTVTISPPSSVSPDSSIDFGTPDPPSSPDLVAESDEVLAKSQESLSISQEAGVLWRRKQPVTLRDQLKRHFFGIGAIEAPIEMNHFAEVPVLSSGVGDTTITVQKLHMFLLLYKLYLKNSRQHVASDPSCSDIVELLGIQMWILNFHAVLPFVLVRTITYTPSYKKDPPPVPPRTTSKPLISITAQSSTESTQDAYHEGRHLHTSIPGRALYNSTDSLDSTKAVTLAMEAAKAMAGKRHPSTDSHSSVLTCDKAILVSKAEEYLKTPRSSIGIQVEAATDSESESKGSREYHSVGIQVEDDKKGQGRFKRSNSVTTAVQADLEVEGFPIMEDKGLQFGGGFQRHSEPSTPTQYGAVRTVRTQGLFSYRDDYRTPTEPSSPRETSSEATWQLEPPSPRDSTASPVESGRVSPSLRRDGTWFMQLLHTETKRMEGWCKEMEAEAEENDLTEEILGKIRSAVGSAQLLMSQKFQQFYWLCQQNLDPSAMPRPTSQDLAGFWDLLQLSIDDVTMNPEKKLPAPVPKKVVRQRSGIVREKSLDLPDRHRQEARRRLMAAKRAASFRQNSASERATALRSISRGSD
ncbi:hypothetical protein WMY93_017640 [Mugilogobius chulae]|uniref:Disks large-associated protein 5 n=1 Tax=Mugilogobius chulae TaxID=88201 RepID=A0AAW0NPX6_9GOBI